MADDRMSLLETMRKAGAEGSDLASIVWIAESSGRTTSSVPAPKE